MLIENKQSGILESVIASKNVFEIKTKDLGKQFVNQHIFRHLNIDAVTGNPLVICGANGSGKSSLLLCLMGYSLPSIGQIFYSYNNQFITSDCVFKYSSLVAPYMELPEEMNLERVIKFHFAFKKTQVNYGCIRQIAEMMMLENMMDKPVCHFSSGMKQRLKLGLAFVSDTPLLFLDEPCTNLDLQGIAWYQNQIQSQIQNRLIILASNNPVEYSFSQNIIQIDDFKKNCN